MGKNDFVYCVWCNRSITKLQRDLLKVECACLGCGIFLISKYYSPGSDVHLRILEGIDKQSPEAYPIPAWPYGLCKVCGKNRAMEDGECVDCRH
jgi:hypothetical protein